MSARSARVVMSLLLHHPRADGKRQALLEALRVLRASGRVHIADWGRPQGALMRVSFLLSVQLVDRLDRTRDHAAGLIPELIADAGFEGVARPDRLRTAWDTLELLARRSRAPSTNRAHRSSQALAPAAGPPRSGSRADYKP